ncbi:hypothetical protein GLAREA_00824 [Glarea lozoyensis ATCC 20868]|uniref:Restriction of telomere capping protein 4 n=1 Tax=Glarea lozoyensis (strain ATCC 20868 / MF5171) TaxID=1116229 RepID=S3CXK4_GLAL2|nr:uncharacterized protein GLAREA_00824 [Glarea lozoyensis ATCC 20868]EPE29664.1 hypothetical protein GLAREA_00824 [Glarea lozoyensis ATCC 20868]
MSGVSNYLYLQNHTARRVGLTRSDRPSGGCQPKKYKYSSSPSPPPKEFKLHTLEESKQDEAEEDILAPPASESSDDEADRQRANIQPSTNIGKKAKVGKPASSRGKPKGPTINGNSKLETKPKSSVSSQDNGQASPKRKSQEDFEGGVWEKRKKRVKTQAKYGSQSSQGKGKGKSATNVMSSNNSEGGAQKSSVLGFKTVEALSDPDTPPKKERQDGIKKFSPISSPEATPVKANQLKVSGSLSPTPVKKDSGFVKPEYDDFDELNTPNSPSSVASKVKKHKNVANDDPSVSSSSFKMLGGIDELAIQARAFIDQDSLDAQSLLAHENEITGSQSKRCPMCKKMVDDEYLRKFKGLSTRMQMKSCQSHQKTTAIEEWKTKGYPVINWERLSSRIDEHHQFIEGLIKGAECHSRSLLEERIQAGKERNLLTTTSNLIPGYYGARGLRDISQQVMENFSELLRERAVKDKTIAARTVTGFLHSVIVPEVTVLLIADDMKVGTEKARDILNDSVGLGEMVHEDIKDVVKRRVRGSDDDEDFD